MGPRSDQISSELEGPIILMVKKPDLEDGSLDFYVRHDVQ